MAYYKLLYDRDVWAANFARKLPATKEKKKKKDCNHIVKSKSRCSTCTEYQTITKETKGKLC